MATAFPKFFYDNVLNDGTPVASTTAAGNFSVLNLRDWRPYTWWKPTALPATVTVDCGVSVSADYFAVYGHDLFTGGCTIEVRRSTDNFAASNVLVSSKTPANNDPFAQEFTSVSSRYWRLNITGTTAPSIAIAAIGAGLTMPRRLNAGLDVLGRQVVGATNKSEKGHPLGKVITFEEWRKTLSWTGLTWSWLRSTWIPAWESHLRGSPYLFAWDITDNPGEIWLVQSGEQFAAPQTIGSYAELAFDVMGVQT